MKGIAEKKMPIPPVRVVAIDKNRRRFKLVIVPLFF